MSTVQELYRKQAKTLIPRFARRNMEAFYCDTAQEAKDLVLSMIPEGSVVTSGGSVTLEQTGIFQGEGLILPDITGDPPAEEQRRIAGNGSDPEKDQPGPVPGGKFREAGVKRFTAGGKNEEIYDQAADANDGENDLQVNGKLILIHDKHLLMRG